MRNESERHYPFLTALARLHSDYGITLNRDEFIEKAYPIWKSIGNNAQIIRYGSAIVPSNLTIDLPADCKFVDNVTVTSRATFYDNRHGYNSAGTKETLAYNKTSSDVLSKNINSTYLSGETIAFKVENDKLIIEDSSLEAANLLFSYSIIKLDEDGLPVLNEKEIKAVSSGVAFSVLTLAAFKGTLTQQQVSIYKVIKEDSEKLIQAAAIPERMSTAELDSVLDATVSSDRKIFGRKFL